MPSTELSLDAPQLLRQLRELGAIGQRPGDEGRTRIALSEDDKAGRDQLVRWMCDLELDVRIDQVGNVLGIVRPDPGGLPQRPLMIGSHIDTVRNAGALDGCYGVLAGLAVARAYRQAGVSPARSIVVAAFTNEEGVRFQPDMMGSLVYAGGMCVQAAHDTVDGDGERLGDELARIGYVGDMIPGSLVPHEYLELHIEQGPLLEARDRQIGIVETLQGISWQQVTIHGVANHAGTTPTRLRHDAGYAAAACIAFLREQVVGAEPETTLATTGTLRLEPNVINVIPSKATFTVDLRDPDERRLRMAESRFADFLVRLAEREGVRIKVDSLARFEPVVFDAGLAARIETAASRRGLSHMRMTSGAGHDAQMIARIAPSAMIFVPSRGGISHNPREHTDDQQLVHGAQVLLDVVQACMAST